MKKFNVALVGACLSMSPRELKPNLGPPKELEKHVEDLVKWIEPINGIELKGFARAMEQHLGISLGNSAPEQGKRRRFAKASYVPPILPVRRGVRPRNRGG